MQFCIRDDDTSFFTSPDQLEEAYGEATRYGPVSLSVVPYHRAGTSKAVPEKYRGRWTIHPFHKNEALVRYLGDAVARGRFEIMLHGYYHDVPDGRPEFLGDDDLTRRVAEGRKYIESVLGTKVRVFVPPRNAIRGQGLRAVARSSLHLGGTAGVRAGWPLASIRTWRLWLRLRSWRRQGNLGIPWVLDLGDHREIPGTPFTPVARFADNQALFASAAKLNGMFCAATHYWELGAPSRHRGEPPVGEQLRWLIERARSESGVSWRSVGEVVSRSESIL